MKTISASAARKDFEGLIEGVVRSNTPVRITGTRSSAVLLSETQWRSTMETMYLLSITGMRDSLAAGLSHAVLQVREDAWLVRRQMRNSIVALAACAFEIVAVAAPPAPATKPTSRPAATTRA